MTIGYGIVDLAAWMLVGHHSAILSVELPVLSGYLAHHLGVCLTGGMYYLALEPFVRRVWPRTLVSWSRVIGGRVRDPLVGRDVCIGVVASLVCVFAVLIVVSVAEMLQLPYKGAPPADPTMLLAAWTS